jgi:NAD(P)-dependent dehydrogenase (short-subunit alcohol dehydrogenase family)
MSDLTHPLDGMSALITGGGGEGIRRAISRAFTGLPP